MLCYQVTAQFAFHQRKPALVSTYIKKGQGVFGPVRFAFRSRAQIQPLLPYQKRSGSGVNSRNVISLLPLLNKSKEKTKNTIFF
jgi:hypothetical protein